MINHCIRCGKTFKFDLCQQRELVRGGCGFTFTMVGYLVPKALCNECLESLSKPTNFINEENFEMMRDTLEDEMRREATDNVSS